MDSHYHQQYGHHHHRHQQCGHHHHQHQQCGQYHNFSGKGKLYQRCQSGIKQKDEGYVDRGEPDDAEDDDEEGEGYVDRGERPDYVRYMMTRLNMRMLMMLIIDDHRGDGD